MTKKIPLWAKALITAVLAALCAAGSCAGFLANMNRPGNVSGAFAIAFITFCAAGVTALLVFVIAGIVGIVRASRV